MTGHWHGLRLYVCPECYLTKMDAAQMPVHDRDCGGKFKPVEYVPAERLQGTVSPDPELLAFVRDFANWHTTADLNALAPRARELLDRFGGAVGA